MQSLKRSPLNHQHPISSNYPFTHVFTPILFTSKIRKKEFFPKMAAMNPTTCRDDCYYHILAMQARTRLNLATCLVTSMNNLLTAQLLLKDFKMPGWAPLNDAVVKKQIELSDKAGKRSAKDLQHCVDMIKQGCRYCREKDAALYQEAQQNPPEFLAANNFPSSPFYYLPT